MQAITKPVDEPPPRQGDQASARRVATGVLVVCAVAIACSLLVLRQEYIVADAEARLDVVNAAIASGDVPNIGTQDMAIDGPPRALLARALTLARAAQLEPEGSEDRVLLLDRALGQTQSIESERPYWSEAWATRAFVQSLRLGPEAADVRNALDRSYRDAPYLSRAGAWRVGYGFRYWSDLDDQTRDRMLNEAVWLARSSPTMLDSILALARQSPGYRAYIVRWLTARQGDVDFRPLQRASP